MGYNGVPASTNSHFKPETLTGYGAQYTGGYKGMHTGRLLAQVNGTAVPGYLHEVMYYDNRGRLIQKKASSHLSGGVEKEYMAYNFTGQLTARRKVHSATGKTTQTEVYTYTYNHAGRLITTKYKLNSGAEVTLTTNTYDELGRLKKSTRPAAASVEYGYNVRSWTKSISSTNFKQWLYYGDAPSGTKACYNGNVSAMKWNMEGVDHEFRYGYDNLSRLLRAQYLRNGAPSLRHAISAIAYDKHGNITFVQRLGRRVENGIFGIIDHLALTYQGNRLQRVKEDGGGSTLSNSREFKKYATATQEYMYSANGALTKDLNKGISGITYNLVDLPAKVDIKNPQGESRNEYLYDAAGNKLRTVRKWNPDFSTTPVIGSAVTTANLTQSSTTDYVGNKVYENGTLKKIFFEGGYYEPSTSRYYYEVTDYLGSVRTVTYGSGTVLERSNYYPYGMLMAGEGALEDKQPYKFGGKEEDCLRGLNLHDFHARQYEAAIGRFTSMDPMAEDYYSWSPYAYGFCNPARFSDPTGMFSQDQVYNGGNLPELLVTGQAPRVLNLNISVSVAPVSGFWGHVSYHLFGNVHQGWMYNKEGQPVKMAPFMGFPPDAGKNPFLSWKSIKAWKKSGHVKSLYRDVTKGNRKNTAKNIETDITKGEFQQNLKDRGFKPESIDGGE